MATNKPSATKYFPPASFYFSVTIGGRELPFQEASGLDVDLEVTDVVEGGVNTYKHRLPVRTVFKNLVLKRGLAVADSDTLKWLKDNTFSGNQLSKPIETKDIIVTLKDEKGEKLMAWSFEKAYPVKWSVSGLNAKENALAIETLEFAYRMFEIK